MTPREYLKQVCRPILEDFENDPTSIRRAWASATSLLHLVDCLAANSGQKVDQLRPELAVDFPRLPALADVANASKHFVLNRGRRAGLSVDYFEVGSSAAFSDGSYFSDGTSFSDVPDVVRVQFGGELIDVLHLCREAIAYFETKVP
jgi:hypothetical protein